MTHTHLLIYRETHTIADVKNGTHIYRCNEGHTHLLIYRRTHTVADIQKYTHTQTLMYIERNTFADIDNDTHTIAGIQRDTIFPDILRDKHCC